MFTLDTKPECRACKGDEREIDDSLARDLLYSLFNPYHREKGNVNLFNFVKEHLKNEELKQFFENFSFMLNDMIRGYKYISRFWSEKIDDYVEAKKKAWEEIKRKLKEGELKREDLSTSELVNYFYEEIIEDLKKEGYLEDDYFRGYKFTKNAERALSKKILQLSLQDLTGEDFGEHETEKTGVSSFLKNEIVEYDELRHSYDSIDLQETLVKCALRDPSLRFDERDLVAREGKHMEKCVYVMLIDVSDSMRGRRIVGALESALALRKVIKKSNMDELHVVAFNHRVRKIKDEEILNLRTRGRTDIGLALKTAREIIKKRRGSGVIFLITDGEPTSSYDPYLTPTMCALREAEKLRKVDANLTIVMLSPEKRFLALCERIAKLSRKANLVYIENPLNMKKFFVKSYMRRLRF
ncbi:VWA domain-containing protein [Archaeoglobus profundus]|uniref:von Willebrand factor type A n=1 Tax=Archaeoglobus profundus (strain DSM 5631 / JCM 9629 / NBRC 100127 / Av18) TaxID=572546 RepID=D2RGD5_ARCPA|nr:VWA domain-containing protein [Archaeoglobus profundus]ADB57360.1 von Willebrand factor type A [Archaeoglobus profundus DSM 5631]